MRNRSSATHALRSRKLAEEALQRKFGYLTQLEGAYSQIEQAVDQVAMIEAMKGTTHVLRGLHSAVGGVEEADNVMEELRIEMLKVEGIGDSFRGAGQEANTANDEVIEAELDQLIHQTEMSNADKQVAEVATKLNSIITPLRSSSDVSREESSNHKPAAVRSTRALSDGVGSLQLEDNPSVI